jgi:adenosylmethionine-8-amino-7-oxononanoate aminotransferase
MAHARPKISRGEGIYLWDESGKRYIDGSGGPLVINVGHGRSEIVEAMTRQAESAAYVHATMFTSEPLEQYAAKLAQVVPIPDARFYLLSTGSEVVEGAVKLARQIQMARGEESRHLIISRWKSYHGMSLGALAVSGRVGMRQPYTGMFRDMPHIDPPYLYRDAASGAEAADRLEEAILAHGPENVAGFIAEPISGASLGAAVPPDEYWPRIRQICDRYGLLLIADEVLVGMGRTGTWWGINHWDVIPDIMVASKGVAGGYFPLGVVAARGEDVDQIAGSLGDFNHGGTFSHHAVGAAAGLATIRVIEDEKLITNSAEMGRYLGQKLYHALNEHPLVGDVRGRGLFWGVEFVQDRETKTPFPAGRHLAWDIWQRAFEMGLITYYSQGCADGVNGDLIMLGPPLIVNKEQVDEMVQILVSAIQMALGH